MRKILFFAGIFLFVAGMLSPAAGTLDFDHSHVLFDKVLKRFVHDGLVDYAALKKDSADLDQYLAGLEAVTEPDFKQWSREQQIAYLVNLYNARTLRLIADHYPVKSIKQIGNLLQGPWDQPVVRLFGNTGTLNMIEHKMLRKNYDEPRVHFALVCAARGCPPLRNEAYTASRLSVQLDDQGRIFLSTPHKNSVDMQNGVLNLSPIFKWFREDFVKKSGSEFQFIKLYLPAAEAGAMTGNSYKIRYTFYDWSLNDIKSGG